MDKIPDLEPLPGGKTLTELLEAGVPHKGGLAQLAAAEKAGGLWSAKRKGRPVLKLVTLPKAR